MREVEVRRMWKLGGQQSEAQSGAPTGNKLGIGPLSVPVQKIRNLNSTVGVLC